MSNNAQGLTSAKAAKLLEEYGANELKQQSRPKLVHLFISQFTNVLILLLIVAAAVSYIVGEHIDSYFIVTIIAINALLGFFQEYKAENALASLKKMTISSVRVLRDGIEMLIDSTLLVPGDIVKLEQGDKVPGDGAVIDSMRFEVNEASLTGESLPVEKSSKSKEASHVYMGTIVTSGRAVVRIIKTGSRTTLGRMAKTLETMVETSSPLSKKINRLGKQLTFLAAAVVVLLFVIGLVQGRDAIEMLLISISLAVAAVPEGLPAVITITLAIGLQRMARQKAIMKKLHAIEALGNTTVIATDKTGTLTENNMRVTSVWYDNNKRNSSSLANKQVVGTLNELVTAGIICNSASLVPNQQSTYTMLGDQTEGSLLYFAQDLGVKPNKVRGSGKVIDELSFDSSRKLMSVLWKTENGKTLYTKGAPEEVLKLSTHLLENGEVKKLSQEDKQHLTSVFQSMAAQGLRVLALSNKTIKPSMHDRQKYEKNLTLIGFVGISDPPRKEARSVIENAYRAGISIVMVTGDNKLTASAIARAVGLNNGHDTVTTSAQLADMSDEELEKRISSIRIFARAKPEDKLRIVKTLQKQGNIVAVTGDGVNDSLALKAADIGIAMGITGTDTAKEVADMVITDDNLASIVRAIGEGRMIFANIVKSVTYLVSCNLGEVLTIFAAIVFGLPVPLIPAQILWINLATDSLPALSLAFDPATNMVMLQKPHTGSQSILNKSNLLFISISGIIIAIITLVLFEAALSYSNLPFAQTIAFTSLVLLQMVMVFLVRPKQRIFSNPFLLASVLLVLVLQAVVVMVSPINQIFSSY